MHWLHGLSPRFNWSLVILAIVTSLKELIEKSPEVDAKMEKDNQIKSITNHSYPNNLFVSDEVDTTRRKAIFTLGSLSALGVLGLSSCGGGGSSGSSLASVASSTLSSSSSSVSSSSSSTSTSSSSSTTSSTSSTSLPAGAAWLAGGTAAMTAAFPPTNVPFASVQDSACQISLSEATIGPCFFDTTDTRDDISEGQPGIPMVLALKLIDSHCNPLVGAVIEVWWCNNVGIYSGDNSASTGKISSFNTSFCTGNDSAALKAKWFRGIKTTDSNGIVYFKACYPGWYTSRTTHIHFRIVVNGTQQLISQFCFDDALNNDIYANHTNYKSHGKNTSASNTKDTVFSSGTYQNYQMNVMSQSDNSMIAYKTVKIIV